MAVTSNRTLDEPDFTDYHQFRWYTSIPLKSPLPFILPRFITLAVPGLLASIAIIHLTQTYPNYFVRESTQILLIGMVWLLVIAFVFIWYIIYRSRGSQVVTGTIGRQGISFHHHRYLTNKFLSNNQNLPKPFLSPKTQLWTINLLHPHFILQFNSQADANKAIKALDYYATHPNDPQ